jgi:hypothetical protein
MPYYLPDEILRNHRQEHEENPAPTKAPFCRLCYPYSPTEVNSQAPNFPHFWTWLQYYFYASDCTRYTVAAFRRLDSYNPQTEIARFDTIASLLLKSVTYSQIRTSLTDLRWYFRRAYIDTTGFQQVPSNAQQNAAVDDYLQEILQAYPLLTSETPPATMTTYTQDQLDAIINNAVGNALTNMQNAFTQMQTAYTTMGTTNNNLTNAINNMPAGGPRELNVVKIADFHGKDEEDPFEWIDLFEQAATANRWAADRKVDIAAGYLKTQL